MDINDFLIKNKVILKKYNFDNLMFYPKIKNININQEDIDIIFYNISDMRLCEHNTQNLHNLILIPIYNNDESLMNIIEILYNIYKYKNYQKTLTLVFKDIEIKIDSLKYLAKNILIYSASKENIISLLNLNQN